MSVTAVTVLLLVFLILVLFFISYKKVPKNKIGIRVGPFGNKTVTGKAIFVIPFLQRIDYMTLQNIQVDFVTKDSIPTQDAINIKVDAVANVSISQDPEIMKHAASRFTGYSTGDICNVITPVLEGNIREIISQIKLKELIQGDKKVLADKIAENVKPNLADLGLELTTFNIQNFKDDAGVINNLGIENTVSISKDASKAKAAAEAEVQIAQAEADKAANDARVAAELEIAQKRNELALKKAALQTQADTELAKAEAAKGIEAENQRKIQEIAAANANIAAQEKQIELQEKAVAIKEKALEAEIKKTAEADKYAVQQKADAELYERTKRAEAELAERQRNAEADKYEKEQEAEATERLAEAQKQKALAEAAAVKAKGDAEAAAIQAKALAEAEGIEKKLLAEANGLRERAEALKLLQDAGKLEMQLNTVKVLFEQLPAIYEATAKPFEKVGSITMYGGNGDNGAALTGNITKTISQVGAGLKDSLGIDLGDIVNGLLTGKLAGKELAKAIENSKKKDDEEE
ncbi:MAG: hypothetical protein J5930_11250 [Treponema sp.]|nr:hypothetical protein [Treponema sp.]